MYMPKVPKFIRYIEGKLYMRNSDGKVLELGDIKTRKGALTRVQKLEAVAASGVWVEI